MKHTTDAPERVNHKLEIDFDDILSFLEIEGYDLGDPDAKASVMVASKAPLLLVVEWNGPLGGKFIATQVDA